MAKHLRAVMPDGTWLIPLDVIARIRAAHYADEFGGDVERSLAEDTLPLFESQPGEVYEWAVNNMNWSDVAKHAVKVLDPPKPRFDREEAWLECEKSVVEIH